tara:strand:+ start:92 stop:589 length:498 start_codon:yes stop_codon:yes gene_type:complete
MSDYLLKIGSKIRSFPSIKYSRYQIKDIDKLILSHLNLSDMGKLRDRFEGQSFYDKKSRIILAYLGVCKHLNITPLDINKINLSHFVPYVTYNSIRFKIIISDFGEFPIIEKQAPEPFIFVIARSNLEYSIVGYCDEKELKNSKNFKPFSTDKVIYNAIDNLISI